MAARHARSTLVAHKEELTIWLTRANLRQTFNVIDRNGDGLVSRVELQLLVGIGTLTAGKWSIGFSHVFKKVPLGGLPTSTHDVIIVSLVLSVLRSTCLALLFCLFVSIRFCRSELSHDVLWLAYVHPQDSVWAISDLNATERRVG